jgi:GT2 family glycosyltransferase
MKISIIIPTYNEESTIERLMKTLEPLNERCEILFVDGGSTDGTLALLKDRYPVIQSPKGRAKQMNKGAEESSGDVLFFLHCDSEVPATALEEIETVMKKYRAGCFGIAFHSYNFFMLFLTKGGIYEVTLHLPKCFIYYWTILYFIRIRWFIASNCSSSSILYYWSNLFNEIIKSY